VWVRLIDLSELRPQRDGADVLAAMKKDGLAFHATNQGPHLIAVTTKNAWMARRWDMSALTDQEGLELGRCDLFPKETFLDRLGHLGGVNLMLVVVLAAFAFAWLLRQ
jgi:hypothetical protein